MRLAELTRPHGPRPNPIDAQWKVVVGFQHGGTVYFEATVQAASDDQAALVARDQFHDAWGTLLTRLPSNKISHVNVSPTEKPTRWQVNLGFKRGNDMIHYLGTVTATKHNVATLKARDAFENVLRTLPRLPKLTYIKVTPQNKVAQEIARQDAKRHLAVQNSPH